MDDIEAGLQQLSSDFKARTRSLDELAEELKLGNEVVQHPKARGWFSDVGGQVIGGAARAVTSSIDGIAAITDKIPRLVGNSGIRVTDGGIEFFVQSPEEFKQAVEQTVLTAPSRAIADAIGDAQTKSGALVGGISQFLVGLLGTKKFFKAAQILQGTGKATAAARSLAESAVASGLAFEGHDANIANLIEASKADGGVPDLSNALTAALATKDNDSELMGRIKNMVTDAGAGALADALIGGIRAVRAGKQARQAIADDIAAEVAGNKVDVDLDREIKFESDTVQAPTEIRSPKTGDILEIAQDSPATTLKLSTPPFEGRSDIALETPEELAARLGDDIASPEATRAAQLEAVAAKATAVADEAKQSIEESKPAAPLKEMSDGESYDNLREELGITDEKLSQIRADVEAGTIGREDVADLLHFNPSKFDWSKANDPESQVALMNTFTRVFADALGKAGTGRVPLDTIFAQANRIGADVDAAINLWKRLRGVEAGVRAQQFVVAASGAHLDRLAKKIAGGKGTAQELLDFVVHDKRHALLQVTAQGSRSMIGRALRVMREGVQVNEAALKLANGRRLRAERKARDVAGKANEAAQIAKERATKKETARKARADADAATKRRQTAASQVEMTENELTEIAAKFLSKAHKERLLGEQREAIRVAKEAVASADKKAAAAEKLARKAESDLTNFESANERKFGNKEPTADVVLTGGTKLQFDEVNEALANLGLKPEQVVDLAKEIAKRETSIQRESAARLGTMMKLQDRLTFLYINNILSGLPTMAINASSGLLKMIESTFEHYGSAALSRIRGDKYAILAANKAAVATWTSWKTAWKLAGEAWKEGLPQTDILAKAEVAVRGGAGDSLVAKAIGIPSRAIITIDEFFKHIFYQQELNARAVEIAASAAQLQSGAVAQQRMFDKVLKETLESPPDDLVLDSIEKARYQTFQGNLESKFANDLIRMTNNTPLLKFVVPFVKTPTNIFKQGIIERSPLNLLRKSVLDEIRAGTREGNTAIVRVALGTALIGTVWNLADEGLITGSRAGYGSNQNTGDIENIPPYSINLFGKWYQYNRFDPLGTPLGLVADLRIASKDLQERENNGLETDDPTLSEHFGNILAILNKNLLDKTFFKGISDIVSALDDSRSGADALGNYLQTVGTSLIPYSSFVKNIAKSHDDYAREAFEFSDKLLLQTPGLSTDLPVKRDILGRPIPNAERLGPSWVSPFLAGVNDPDPVAQELAKLRLDYRKPSKDIAGVKLSAEQYSRLLEIRGGFLHEQMSKWIKAGEWSGLTKYEKIEHIRRFLSSGTSRAEKAVLEQWPGLGENVRSLKLEARALRTGALQ